eukprot:728681_1
MAEQRAYVEGCTDSRSQSQWHIINCLQSEHSMSRLSTGGCAWTCPRCSFRNRVDECTSIFDVNCLMCCISLVANYPNEEAIYNPPSSSDITIAANDINLFINQKEANKFLCPITHPQIELSNFNNQASL